MTTLFSLDAQRLATTPEQAIAHRRHQGVRQAIDLLKQPRSTADDALQVVLASVERQARIAGCGRVRLEVTR